MKGEIGKHINMRIKKQKFLIHNKETQSNSNMAIGEACRGFVTFYNTYVAKRLIYLSQRFLTNHDINFH